MPSFVNNFLQALNPNQILKDFKHASRLYIDGRHRLEPKRPWLYYVVINKFAGAMGFGSNTSALELGQLVRQAQLPSYNFNVETQNQYNRKTQKQTSITYDPVQIQFHDDNADVVVGFFNDYYKYYHRDSKYESLQFDPDARYKQDFQARWGLDNDQTTPFLRDIQIFTINKRRFTSYTLILPTITQFAHDTVAQQADGTLSHTMTVAYEAVLIKQGSVGGAGPTGFADLHYDKSPSPLTIAGGGTASIFGPGGLVQGGLSAFNKLATPGQRAGGILEAINIYRNYRTGGYTAGAGEEISGVLKNKISGIRTTNIGTSSAPGITFPRKQRLQKVDAVLLEDKNTTYRADDSLPNRTTPDAPSVSDPESNAYAVVDDSRLLTPDESYTYFKNNFIALDGLARDYVYRTDQQDIDDVNTVKENYELLEDETKAKYRALALGKVKKLATEGQIALVLDVDQINQKNTIALNELGSYVITTDGDYVTETYTDDDGEVTTYTNPSV